MAAAIGFFNGRFLNPDDAAVLIEDRGFQFGDGVYEVVRTWRGNPLLTEAHLARLKRSADAIRISLPYSLAEISAIMHKAVGKAGFDDALIYLQVTRGAAPRQHLFPSTTASFALTVRPALDIPAAKRQAGYKACLLPDERWANCYIKSLNLLPNILAKQSAFERGYDEAVLVRDGFVMEGSSTNVFMICGDDLITPPADKFILNGITRMELISLAGKAGLNAREEKIAVKDLEQADEVFLASTMVEVMPLAKLDERSFGAHPKSLSLWQVFREAHFR